MNAPINCHLWTNTPLQDADVNNVVTTIETFQEDDHFSRRLVRCARCGQLYLKEFYEEVDWVAGNDPQFITWVPVESAEEAARMNAENPDNLNGYVPRLKSDWPSDAEKNIYWVR